MNKIFSCGESLEEYSVKVVNENEVRASAGILFTFALIAFLNTILLGNFFYTKIFIVAFMIEFGIRVLVNPKFAPVMIIAKLATRTQKPLYTGALQKRWAWSIGLVLSLIMFYLMVLNDIRGPINMLICVTCLTLLFFEAVFGICVGCKLYKVFNKYSIQDCPSGKCEIHTPDNTQKIGLVQLIVVGVFAIAISTVSQQLSTTGTKPMMMGCGTQSSMPMMRGCKGGMSE